VFYASKPYLAGIQDGNREQSTNSVQLVPVKSGHTARGRPLPSEGEHRLHYIIQYSVRVIGAPFGAAGDIIIAPKVQFSKGSIITAFAASSSQYPLIACLESSKSPIPDQIHRDSSESSRLESNHASLAGASSPLAVCDEQSLRGFLSVVDQHPLSARPGHRTHPTLPGHIEQQRGSTLPVDTEGLLRELEKLATPLPPLGTSPCRNHRYLASVELLQDRSLIRALQLPSLRIELLEREWINGADLVFDCDTALVFAPLSQVLHPSSSRSLKGKLCSLSWRYTHIVVVFKLLGDGVSGLQCLQDEERQANLFARVIKSIKKIYRELALAEAYGTKRSQTVVQLYFVRSIEQAATTTRVLGDIAESRSQFGPWDDRLWLGLDEQEVSFASLTLLEPLEVSFSPQEERYLSSVDGMNAFAAAVILSQISLHDFLALRADQRQRLALPIPEGMIVGVNSFYSGMR
jgi:hypothetical protein